MKKFAFCAAALSLCMLANAANAATMTFGMSARATTSLESSALEEPAPVEGRVVTFTLTTDADILAIQEVAIEITTDGGATWSLATNLYQNSNGNNVSKPSAAFVNAIPPLGADSWIRLAPTGQATLLGVDMPGDGTANTAWGDTSVAIPPPNFEFAQITVPKGTAWRFRGIAVVESAPGQTQPFTFSFIPEPATSGLAGFAMLGFAALRRRRLA